MEGKNRALGLKNGSLGRSGEAGDAQSCFLQRGNGSIGDEGYSSRLHLGSHALCFVLFSDPVSQQPGGCTLML